MASQQQNPEYNQANKTDNFLEDDCKYDMKHIVIYGPPGSGKTLLGRILAKISLHLGISSNDKFIIAKRSDLIGEFLGMTAIKTQKMIDKAIGGTLFIDEAYSLGSSEKDRDIYAKECIDTLNQNLTERKGQFQCIIAGYEEELDRNFFSLNPGLKRRFPFKYKIEKYSSKELLDILILKINKINWTIKSNIKNWLYSTNYLNNKMDYFEYYGGDIETWLFNIKIEHGKRVFGKHPSEHQVISKQDIEKGFERYKMHKNLKQKPNLSHLYI
jgi:SpoVK/Ycf46/Vps4 family AAA+-type ATPase